MEAARPALTYDDAVFRAAIKRTARPQFNRVSVRDVLDAFWEAGPELYCAILRHGGEELVAKAEEHLQAEVVSRLRWQVEELGVRLLEEPA